MAAQAILPIYSSIEIDVCRNILFEKVLELIYDPNLEVKALTIKMLVDLIDYIHKPEQREKIGNLFCELTINVNDEVILAIASKLGLLLQRVTISYQ